MEFNELKGITEGLLFASGDEGISVKQLVRILNTSEDTITRLLDELKYDYQNTEHGILLMQFHDVFHLTTKPEHSPYFKKLLETPQTTRMSQAALETLAIIAYQQPITRTEIDDIRGVKSDRPVQTLITRSLIEEIGRKEGIGRPMLFATTKEFLTYFGLTSLEELPPLPEDTDSNQLEQESDLFFDTLTDYMDGTDHT
ncbi:segregation and condensation protein B [Lentibacillus kapialis]|uniref:Segregation and condensation protein B n=1 Tax=Lentibacillus kapialis TaxID=340214 RepID=A0A917PVS1_9BACI|nr:SMC-Scp complex subunit ScpB [Lentibacillus kapialis]GGJ94231.1 segregation and condensation protein B [Lentibacillus kapialis]